MCRGLARRSPCSRRNWRRPRTCGLEHEQDYRVGKGWLQEDGTLPLTVRGVGYYEHDDTETRVIVTEGLTLGVRQATAAAAGAAETMARAVLIALHASIA